MIRRRLAAFLRALADRIAPPELEPEVMSYADFVESLRKERDEEIERASWTEYQRKLRRVK